MAEDKTLEEVKRIGEALSEARSEMTKQVEKQNEEIRKFGETSDATAKAIKSAEQQLQQIGEDAKSQDERLADLEKRVNRPGYGDDGEAVKSAGAKFIESEVFDRMKSNGRPTGERLEMRSITNRELKDVTSAGSSAGALIDAMRINQIFRDPADRLQHIRDLMNVDETESNAIEFPVDRSGFTNAAGPQTNEFDAKNESNQTFELITEPVTTLAHWIPASRQVLDDAPMLRSYIDGRLLEGLMNEEDDQILNGDGTSGNLSGILNNPDIQNAGATGSFNANDTILDHVRRAVALARKSNYSANGILMNPEDWADLELKKGSDEHYIWITVPQGGEPRLWRVPVIESNAIQSGDFLLGNWNLAATLWDRMQSNIRVSDSHMDFFTKNAVAILAEERLALTVYRPQAFVKGQWPGLT